MTINAAAIADAWNAPIHDALGNPLSADEHAYKTGRSYALEIQLKTSSQPKHMVIDAPRRIDAFIQMAVQAEDEGWDHLISRVEIEERKFG